MGIYYVAKSGNDTTGDGTQANPWLTIAKAKNTISIAGNHVVNIGAGTYAENDGAGYLVTNRAFVLPVTFQSQSGIPGDVVLTSASGGYNVYQNGAFTNWTFKDLTIQARTGTDCFTGNQSAAFSGLVFENVVFVADGTGATRACYTLASAAPATAITQTVQFSGCVFKAAGGTAGWGIRGAVNNAAPAGTRLNIYAYGCRSDDGSLNVGFEAGPGCGAYVYGGRWFGGVGKGVLIAIDGPFNARETVGGVYGAHIRSNTAHALLVGGGSRGVQVFGCLVQNGDHATVIKAASDVTMKHCISEAGTINALLLKGVTGGEFKYNILRSELNGNAPVFAQFDGDSSYINTEFSVDRNLIVMRGSSKAIRWDALGDGSGNVINNTVYHDRRVNPSLSWGRVLSESDVYNPAEIHTAFLAGGKAHNETNQGAPIRVLQLRHTAKGSVLYALLYYQNGSVYSANGFIVPKPTESGFLARCTIPLYEETPYVYAFIWPADVPAGIYSVHIFSQNEYGLATVDDLYLGSILMESENISGLLKDARDLAAVASQGRSV